MCCYEGIYKNRFGRSFGSHPQANIDEMLVPPGFPRDLMRARRTSIYQKVYSFKYSLIVIYNKDLINIINFIISNILITCGKVCGKVYEKSD